MLIARFGIGAVVLAWLVQGPAVATELEPLARPETKAGKVAAGAMAPYDQPSEAQPAPVLSLRPAPSAGAPEAAPVRTTHRYLLWFWVVVGALSLTAAVVALAAPPPPQPYRGNFEYGGFSFP